LVPALARIATRLPEIERQCDALREMRAMADTDAHCQAPRPDFSRAGIRSRWQADLHDGRSVLAEHHGKAISIRSKASICTNTARRRGL